jgi:hypothetical protein
MPAALDPHPVCSGTEGGSHAQTAIKVSSPSQDDGDLGVQPAASTEDAAPSSAFPLAESPLDALSASPRVQVQTCPSCFARTVRTVEISPHVGTETDTLTPALLILKGRLELVDALERYGTGVPSAAGGTYCLFLFWLFFSNCLSHLRHRACHSSPFFLPYCFFLLPL